MEPEHRDIMKRLAELRGSADEAVQAVDQWAGDMARVIDTPGDGEMLCLYGRALTMATILASLVNHSDLWVEDRIRHVLSLLDKAATTPAKINSDYRRNCKDRPRDFIDGLKVAYEGNATALAMVNKIAAEFQPAIDRGISASHVC